MESFICCVPFGALAEVTFGFLVVVFVTVDEPDELCCTGVVLFWVTAAACGADADCDVATGCDAEAEGAAGCDADGVPAVGCTTAAEGDTVGCVPADDCPPVAGAVPVPLAPSAIVPLAGVFVLEAAPVLFAVPAFPETVAPSLILPDSAVVTTELSESLDVPLSLYTRCVYWFASSFALFLACSVFPVMVISLDIFFTPLKAFSLTSDILSGSVIAEILPMLANASFAIIVTEFGIVTSATLPLYLYNTLLAAFVVNPDEV